MQKLYVVIRNDMPIEYQGVQGGHAVAQWMLENPDQKWNNNYLIYLQTEDIERLRYKLNLKDIKHSHFIEPDLDNKITAIACQSEDKLFKKLKLMGS